MIRYYLFIYFVLLLSNHAFPQKCDDFDPYIPYAETSLEEVPEVNINLVFHVIQHSKKTPKNLTEKEIWFIDSLVYYCNVFLSLMEEPTIKPDVSIEFFRDTRIRLHKKEVKFYQDSADWNRFYIGPYISKTWPWEIDSICLDENAIFVKSNHARKLKSIADSIQIVDAAFNSGIYHTLDAVWENKLTKIILKEPLKNDFQKGRFTYFQKYDKNCYPDLWQKYTQSDSNAIHIFLTGSDIYNGSFGCGPSPYFLNYTNMTTRSAYPTSQLLLHEIGHCLGLYHTDRPQFDDLPKTDRFCSCDCNKTDVSNNIMGYNLCRRYLSPKQVGYIHRIYNTDPSRIRVRKECVYNPDEVKEVRGRTEWNRSFVVSSDVVVKRGGTLTVNCMLSMPPGSSIYLEKKAKLIVNGSITNACGGKWNGVRAVNRHGKAKQKPLKPHQKGVLIVNEGGQIERTR